MLTFAGVAQQWTFVARRGKVRSKTGRGREDAPIASCPAMISSGHGNGVLEMEMGQGAVPHGHIPDAEGFKFGG